MDPNNVVIVDFAYDTFVLIHCFMVTVLHKGTGQRLRATILLEERDSNSVFYCIKWVERLQNINAMIYTPRRIYNNNSDTKDSGNSDSNGDDDGGNNDRNDNFV
eukprot:11026516-Ditylum_brightwellii.AAC.1